MEANLNIDPEDEGKEVDGCLDRLIPIIVAILITIIVYYIKK